MLISEFQKKVLAKLIDIHLEIKSLHRSEPALSATRIEMLETMEDFQRVEPQMGHKQAFETLVGFPSVSKMVYIVYVLCEQVSMT